MSVIACRYRCSVCDKAFSRPWLLRGHLTDPPGGSTGPGAESAVYDCPVNSLLSLQVSLHGVRQGVLSALAAAWSPALTHFTKLTHQGAAPPGGGICCLLLTRCCHVQVPLFGVRQGVLAAVAAARSSALTHAPSSPN